MSRTVIDNCSSNKENYSSTIHLVVIEMIAVNFMNYLPNTHKKSEKL
mgnify:CR=1 FL=1